MNIPSEVDKSSTGMGDHESTMDAMKDVQCMQGRILALECVIRSQLVDRALERHSPVTWLHEIREAMQGTLRDARQAAETSSNEAWSEGATALDELFGQAEAGVKANLERTPREFPCD